ncbi:MAG: tellurite methyltransferase [Nitrospinales bacterium]
MQKYWERINERHNVLFYLFRNKAALNERLVIDLLHIYYDIITETFDSEVYMSLKDKKKWDAKYSDDGRISSKAPSEWLTTHTGLLSGKGKALDIAAGEGRNSVFAASMGYEVVCMDISEVALSKAHALAREKNVKITTLSADLDNSSLPKNEYDLIICFNFLERNLFPEIQNTLKAGGILFYETFTVDYLKYSNFKRQWVLEHNELLKAFQGFRILRYREVDENQEAFASLIAQKI